MSPTAATHTGSAQRAVAFARRGFAPLVRARTVLAVESIGQLVPAAPFLGRVHSVFAQACNLALDDTLLTVCAFGAGNGATVLRLARGAPTELRDHFDVGERIDARAGSLRTRRVELLLEDASVWRPADLGASLPAALVATRLHDVRLSLAKRRAIRPNVLDTAAAPVIAALAGACRDLDLDAAVDQVARLIGWGEGLTPAGDDFLVGLTAGLGALARDDELRHRFLGTLAAAIRQRTRRTTPIAAHCLRLAAAGHHAEPLVDLRRSLLCDLDEGALARALDRALAVGSSSGADTVSGLLAGLLAWLAPPATACGR